MANRPSLVTRPFCPIPGPWRSFLPLDRLQRPPVLVLAWLPAPRRQTGITPLPADLASTLMDHGVTNDACCLCRARKPLAAKMKSQKTCRGYGHTVGRNERPFGSSKRPVSLTGAMRACRSNKPDIKIRSCPFRARIDRCFAPALDAQHVHKLLRLPESRARVARVTG
jgi:hypothetical protein